MRDIGKNMKQLREEKGLKQEQLAELLFVTRQTISNYENGRSRPDIDMLEKIAEALGTDINSILYGPAVPEDKKDAKKRLAISALISALFGLLMMLSLTFLNNRDHYIIYGSFLNAYLLRPLFLLSLGWTMLQMAGIYLKLKPIEKSWSKTALHFTMAAALLLLFGCLPTYIQLIGELTQIEAMQAFSISFPPIQAISALVVRHYYLFFLLGALLWLFGFPQTPKKKLKEQ